MKKITVLGSGLVGSAIIKDLAKQYLVRAVDAQSEQLDHLPESPQIEPVKADVTDPQLFQSMVQDSALVVGALPGFLGYQSVKMAIDAGVNMVDISFFPENPFQLNRQAEHRGVAIITDCGVAPGMSNLILGYHNAGMRIEHFRCLVGGLPVKRQWPWQYRAVFSPVDVIEEYTRPARYIEGGQPITREALSDPELIDFDEIGTLEAFNSDGLRTLLTTMNIPNMIEKTLRYPGTIDYLRMLREAGFFSREPVDVNGSQIKPLDLTANLLFPQWQLREGEKEFTVMRIEIEGFEEGRQVKHQYDLLDYYDKPTATTSMARTTGYTCTAVANLLIDKSFTTPGVHPPEILGAQPHFFQYILNYLKERGVIYNHRRTN